MADDILHYREGSAKTLDELLDLFKLYRDTRWLFRGQADWDWKLEPSIQRLKKAYWPSNDLEEMVTHEFKKSLHLYLEPSQSPKTELELHS